MKTNAVCKVATNACGEYVFRWSTTSNFFFVTWMQVFMTFIIRKKAHSRC